MRAILFCVLLWTCFAIISFFAARQKSSTADESGHAIVGWFMLWQNDYRVYGANPPLWEDWIALGTPRDAIRFDPSGDSYRYLNIGPVKPFWSAMDRSRLLHNGRVMCWIIAVVLAIVISIWAWQIAGPVAAVAATFLYAWDPNFVGHGPLIKNDVACALLFVAAAQAIWLCGRRLTWPRALALALLIGAALNVKFTGLLLLPIAALALIVRAVSSEPWQILGRSVVGRWRKCAASAATCVLVLLISWAMIWTCYRFRFSAGPNGMTVSMNHIEENLAIYNLKAQLHRNPFRAELDAWRPGLATRAIMLSERIGFVPQGFAAGLLFTQLTNQGEEDAFLLGVRYLGGKSSYFPLAFVFKEPIALLAFILIALVVGLLANRSLMQSPVNCWTAVCLALPAAFYAIAVCTSEINIGYRHFFPVLPFVYIALGLAASKLWQRTPGRAMILLIAAGMAVETACAYPNYIAFFNVAAAPHRMKLLADSNLDWGQDLPLLADWQRANPQFMLYLDYFGDDDPSQYGLKYVDLHSDTFPPPSGPAVVAVSATLIQMGGFNSSATRQLAIDFRRPPLAILGGTIYLFRVAN